MGTNPFITELNIVNRICCQDMFSASVESQPVILWLMLQCVLLLLLTSLSLLQLACEVFFYMEM